MVSTTLFDNFICFVQKKGFSLHGRTVKHWPLLGIIDVFRCLQFVWWMRKSYKYYRIKKQIGHFSHSSFEMFLTLHPVKTLISFASLQSDHSLHYSVTEVFSYKWNSPNWIVDKWISAGWGLYCLKLFKVMKWNKDHAHLISLQNYVW